MHKGVPVQMNMDYKKGLLFGLFFLLETSDDIYVKLQHWMYCKLSKLLVLCLIVLYQVVHDVDQNVMVGMEQFREVKKHFLQFVDITQSVRQLANLTVENEIKLLYTISQLCLGTHAWLSMVEMTSSTVLKGTVAEHFSQVQSALYSRGSTGSI